MAFLLRRRIPFFFLDLMVQCVGISLPTRTTYPLLLESYYGTVVAAAITIGIVVLVVIEFDFFSISLFLFLLSLFNFISNCFLRYCWEPIVSHSVSPGVIDVHQSTMMT